MKIALYLGSFNPFHNGHLAAVKSALNDFKMDKVIIVPTMQNPWKKEKVLDIDDRIYIIMVTFSTVTEYIDDEENPEVEVSEIEKELTPPYYSYATLHALKNKYCNDEIFVLCGEDTIKDIPNWMNGEAIIQDYNFIIVDRPEKSISSTEIRNKVRNNESIEGLIDSYTAELIIKKYYK